MVYEGVISEDPFPGLCGAKVNIFLKTRQEPPITIRLLLPF